MFDLPCRVYPRPQGVCVHPSPRDSPKSAALARPLDATQANQRLVMFADIFQLRNLDLMLGMSGATVNRRIVP
jgi:hypothetical protein